MNNTPLDLAYDAVSFISAVLLTSEINGKQVFNEELPLSDGVITCPLPAIVTSFVAGSEVPIDCLQDKQTDTLQLTFRGDFNELRKDLVRLVYQTKSILKLLRGKTIGKFHVIGVGFSSPRYDSESDNEIRRIDLDVRLTYTFKGLI